MEVGSLTMKDVLAKKFGDDKADQILSDLQEGINQKLSADELRQRAKAIAGEGRPAVLTSDVTAIGTTSAASLVAI